MGLLRVLNNYFIFGLVTYSLFSRDPFVLYTEMISSSFPVTTEPIFPPG